MVAALAGQGPPPAKWWQSAEVKAQLRLTDDQVRRVDEIYSSSLPERTRLVKEAEQLSSQLEALLACADCTEEAVLELSERAAAAQALRSRARIVMLYRMYRVLTPGQRRQLDQLASPRRGPDPPGRRKSPKTADSEAPCAGHSAQINGR